MHFAFGLKFFLVVYSLERLWSKVHLPMLLISQRKHRLIMNVQITNSTNKDYKNKCTKMNCCRKLADYKFDLSPENAEKKFKNIPLFSLSAITAQIFQRFWQSQQLYGNWA